MTHYNQNIWYTFTKIKNKGFLRNDLDHGISHLELRQFDIYIHITTCKKSVSLDKFLMSKIGKNVHHFGEETLYFLTCAIY